jgi:hypothetical protein
VAFLSLLVIPTDSKAKRARHWWLLRRQIRRITVQNQPGKIVHETLS